MGHLATVASCALNQHALDWDGNVARIIESVRVAKAKGARLRTGPELEITGYGCYDHFHEPDTALFAWQSVVEVITHPDCQDILLDIGSPVVHRNILYNCRIIALDKKIILIRPKLWLANDGNYREERWFTGWSRPRHYEEYYLPRIVQKCQGAVKVTIGDCIISTRDTAFAAETCEEIFTPSSPHVDLGLNGVEIFTNSSGSHHQLRKLDQRLNLIINATEKTGGVYLYANQCGHDGDRLYYDGSAIVAMNGQVKAQSSQFSLRDVEVIVATCDLEEVRAKRVAFSSRAAQAVHAPAYKRIEVDFALSSGTFDLTLSATPSSPVFYHKFEEEIALGPAAWLWDYLRRSGAVGYREFLEPVLSASKFIRSWDARRSCHFTRFRTKFSSLSSFQHRTVRFRAFLLPVTQALHLVNPLSSALCSSIFD
jgi:NAD+ synthase (glutamine-hydrolysing)